MVQNLLPKANSFGLMLSEATHRTTCLTSPSGRDSVDLAMTSSLWLLVLLVPASLLLPQLYAGLGKVRGMLAGLFVVLACTGGWFALTRPYQAALAANTDTPW